MNQFAATGRLQYLLTFMERKKAVWLAPRFLPTFFALKVAISLAVLLVARSMFAGILATNLQCGYWQNPLGVDDLNPRLSWQLQSTSPGLRGQSQTACRILVASSRNLLAQNQGDLWDSGQTNLTSPSIPYGGLSLLSGQQVFWAVQAWDQNNQPSGWSTPATWTMGLLSPTNWQAHWITATNAEALPIFRREFMVQPGLQRALIFICGLGQYELSANGAKVGNVVLAPGWSMYPKTCLYDTLDITTNLFAGDNALGVMLGNGMFNVPVSSRYAKFTGSFGPPELIAQIELVYSNGTTQVIATDTNWLTTPGPITFSSVYGGEDHNARLLPTGWNQPGFNASTWNLSAITNGPGGILRGQSHAAPPIQITQTLQPTQTNQLSSATIVYDLGQNAAIIPTLTTHGMAGAVVQITPAETTNADGTVNRNSVGGGSAYWQYTLAGSGSETWFPRFFYHGCRYLEVQLTAASGSSQLPVVDNLQGMDIQSAVPSVGNFSCSVPLFNQTLNLVQWAQRNNLISILTDCPHRERLGWLEEAHLNGPSLRYNFDLDKYARCSIDAMADSQLTSGLVPDIAPEVTVFSGGFRDSPEWGSSVILVPWQQYQFTGDDTLLRQNYGAMTNYLAYLQSQSSGYLLDYGLGDWYDIGPAPEGYGQLTPLGVTASAYFYQDAQTLAGIASETGHASDATAFGLLASNIASAFNNSYYSPANGYYANGSQTAQAMPLELGLVAPTNQSSVLAALVASVDSQGSTSGEIGHRYVLRALTDAGRSDVVFNMNNLTNNGPNAGGYGYMLSQGATSATEGWNADPADSLDHFMWGHIVEWFYHDLAGIQPDPSSPGFKNIIIKPSFVGNVSWVNAGYNSILGPIASDWTFSNNQAVLNVLIPPGATGSVWLPTLGTPTNDLAIQESGVTLWQNGSLSSASTSNVTFVGLEESGSQTFSVWSVGSGSYSFGWNVFPAPAGLLAAAGIGQISLGWNPVPNASGYNVTRSTVSGGPYVTIVSGLTATNYVDGAVTNGTTYYYVVSALYGNVPGANSLQVSGAPGFVANYGFETPGVGTFAYSPAGASWIFTAQSGANGAGIAANGSAFTLSNPNAPQGVQVAFLQGTGGVSQVISGFVPGVDYQVTFAAAQRNYQQNGGQTWNVTVNGAVAGSFAPGRAAINYVNYSATFLATAATMTIGFVGTDLPGGDNTAFIDDVQIIPSTPPAPSGFSATDGNSQVGLVWNSVAGADSYNVKRANSIGGPFNLVGSTVLTNYTDFPLANRLTYYYVVSALNGSGEGSNSSPVGASPGSTVLAGAIIGTPGSWDNLGNTISNVFDGNFNTFFDGPDVTGDWVGLDFGVGVSNVITQILYCPRIAFDSRMTGGVFQAANAADFSSETTLFTIPGVPPDDTFTTQTVSNTNAFRYVRYLGPANGSCNVAELSFYGWNPSVPAISVLAPELAWQLGKGQIQFSWPPDHTGWLLQAQTNQLNSGLTTNWVTLSASLFTNQISLPLAATNGSVFFRLRYP